MERNGNRKTYLNWLRYADAVGGVVLVIFTLEPFHDQINSTTVSFALLLFILLVATFIGRNPALLSSLIAMLGFNYYFLPLGTNKILPSQFRLRTGNFGVSKIPCRTCFQSRREVMRFR